MSQQSQNMSDQFYHTLIENAARNNEPNDDYYYEDYSDHSSDYSVPDRTVIKTETLTPGAMADALDMIVDDDTQQPRGRVEIIAGFIIGGALNMIVTRVYSSDYMLGNLAQLVVVFSFMLLGYLVYKGESEYAIHLVESTYDTIVNLVWAFHDILVDGLKVLSKILVDCGNGMRRVVWNLSIFAGVMIFCAGLLDYFFDENAGMLLQTIYRVPQHIGLEALGAMTSLCNSLKAILSSLITIKQLPE